MILLKKKIWIRTKRGVVYKWSNGSSTIGVQVLVSWNTPRNSCTAMLLMLLAPSPFFGKLNYSQKYRMQRFELYEYGRMKYPWMQTGRLTHLIALKYRTTAILQHPIVSTITMQCSNNFTEAFRHSAKKSQLQSSKTTECPTRQKIDSPEPDLNATSSVDNCLFMWYRPKAE